VSADRVGPGVGVSCDDGYGAGDAGGGSGDVDVVAFCCGQAGGYGDGEGVAAVTARRSMQRRRRGIAGFSFMEYTCFYVDGGFC